jgi:endonuclease/exonuclease/phosphatase (EEP) superfamily protein YafD
VLSRSGAIALESWFDIAIAAAIALLAALSAVSAVPSNAAWIRIWDFPRQQIAALLLALLVVALWQSDLTAAGGLAVVALAVIALAYQAACIWPFTPLHADQAKLVETCPDDSRLHVLVANVLVTNRNSRPLLQQIQDRQPDLVLLVETDPWWASALQSLHADYPYVVSCPQEHYGMCLFSRLPLLAPQVRYLVDKRIPSIKTGVRLPAGATFTLYGLHPEPPPLEHTTERDAELLIVAREIRDERKPAVVVGDLNDVAWSRTTRLFQEISGLLDPRIGRGFYSTYNANWPLMRWPLDHAFFDQSFSLLDLQVLEHIGSDHFPLYISLCYAPARARLQDAPRPEPQDEQRAAQAIREGRQNQD